MANLRNSFRSKTRMYSFIVVAVLAVVTWFASARFQHYDWALLGYWIGTAVFAIGLTIRMTSWLIRPATHQVVRRTIKNMFTKKRVKRNFSAVIKTFFNNIFLQKFIFKRGAYRWIQHFLIAWGCIGSLLFCFGLTMGLFRFNLVDGEYYQMIAFNIPVLTMKAHSLFAELVYNSLNIFASMLFIGVVMALVRRAKDADVKVTQRFSFDLFPLYLLLFTVCTGLFLTLSYSFFDGMLHRELRIVHQIIVIVFLCYFPFGKLFHVPIRPLATAVPMNYQEVEQVDTRACKKCGTKYSNDDQIADVKAILAAQNFDLKLEDDSDLADYCVTCRRRMRAMKQMNMEAPQGNPYDPIQTNNGMHMSGFGKKRDESFYKIEEKQSNEKK